MRGTKRDILTGNHFFVCSLTEEKSGTLTWRFSPPHTLLGFSVWKPLFATGLLGPCFLSVRGKALLQEKGWEKTEKERAHPFLGYNSRAEQSLGLNSMLLWNYVKLIFCLLVQWQPLAMALTWKTINKEIAYSIASVLISLYETGTHFVPLPWVVCVCMCRHKALGRVWSLLLQRRGESREIFLLVFWLVTLPGLLAAQETWSSPQQDPWEKEVFAVMLLLLII